MKLMKSATFFLPFVFCLVMQVGASFETATTFQDCVTALINEGQINCQVARPYTKCAIRTLDVLDILSSEQAIQDFKRGLSQGFSLSGLTCDIDVKSIVDELNAEAAGNQNMTTTTATSVTTKKPDFGSANTFQECTAVLFASNQITCQEARPYTKCAIRTLNLVDQLSSFRTRQLFESSLNAEFRRAGLSCDVDIDVIVQELRSETDGINVAVTTMSSVIINKPDCVDDAYESSCEGRVNGDYPICGQSNCEVGKFITCSNQILYVRNCPLGWYVDNNGNRFRAPTVYNPSSRTCEFSSDSCPRGLDKFVEN